MTGRWTSAVSWRGMLVALVVVFRAGGLAYGSEALSSVGLVSGIVDTSDGVYSISPRGITRGVGEEATMVHTTSIRFFTIGYDPGVGGKARLVLGGGEPGVNGVIGFYSLDEREWLQEELAEDVVYDIAIEATQRMLAVACADGRVLLGTIGDDGISKGRLAVQHQHTAPVRSVNFSSDGKYMASAGLDGLVFVSEFRSTSKPLVLQDHSDKVECVIFSPDSKEVISGARDGRVRIHSVEGRLIRNYSQLGGLQSGTPWQRKNQVLSLVYSHSPPAIWAGTSLGYVLRLSVSDTSSQWIDRKSSPINALAIGESLYVGSNRVEAIPLDQVAGTDPE